MRLALAALVAALVPGAAFAAHTRGAITAPTPPVRAAVAIRATAATATPRRAARVIVFVWDGLRPDLVNAIDTPNLDRLRREGTWFSDHHATFPTLTMMNAASVATGAFPGTSGFYGNVVWSPGAHGADAAGAAVDFTQPAFTEDSGVLADLDAERPLFAVPTLFEAAASAGLRTAAIGKAGPAFLQDHARRGLFLDERMVSPGSLARELAASGRPLPKLAPSAAPDEHLALARGNGDPTAAAPTHSLADGATADPTDASGTPFAAANAYLMDAFLGYVLPEKKPDLSIVWLRNPDATQHAYGIGTPDAKDALHHQDALLGELEARLAADGLASSTDLVVLSDHGGSNVSGPLDLFPLRAVDHGALGAIDPRGHSVSGDVRTADLLARARFTAFDGAGCALSPALSGVRADGSRVYPTRVDEDGSICGTIGEPYTTPSYRVPSRLPPRSVVVAPNGGSDYLYVPEHDPALVRELVRFLQSREEYGAVFVSSRYGEVPGTLPMSAVRAEARSPRAPDVIASFSYDASAMVEGIPGTEHESMLGHRGAHGAFSPRDVHNVLVARGPDFRRGFVDPLPSATVDVAPTIAALLGVPLPTADGRPLVEALAGGPDPRAFSLTPRVVASSDALDLVMRRPTDPDGRDVDPRASRFRVELETRELRGPGCHATYFDRARAVRW